MNKPRVLLNRWMDDYNARARACGIDDARAKAILEEEIERSKASPTITIMDAMETASRRLATDAWDALEPAARRLPTEGWR